MDFRARAEILLGVCEKVVRTGAGEKGAADFWVGEGKLSVPRRGSGAHELLCKEKDLSAGFGKIVRKLQAYQAAFFAPLPLV